MRKTYFIASILLTTLFGLLSGCKKSVTPVSDLVKKVWTANQVDENNTTVYRRGSTSNIRNYTSFKLDLSNPPSVTYVDYDGVSFTGQYSLPNDNTITLTNLTPTPTGTNGTITFTIDSVDDSNLKLTRTTANQKTGSSNNVYYLTNP